ncbi:hypothetical protein EUC41_24050 [Achromobacter denitrificans]|uniref:hypothetical protein n=1 Tax=Achromobacter denitrificans TaxID=32002 RepID=UPI00240D7FC3|nr:hypothetical protein [Achromobacter denitrificans]WFC69131.1 hypothetical protein EUC41_24050 [Achromobacter denitrificans]
MGQLQQRLKWDAPEGAILDADRRYVMLRADVLMGLFAGLPPAQRAQALDSLQASVRTHGGASARAYRAAGAADVAAFLRVMAESAADLGWGAWRFEPGDARPRRRSRCETAPSRWRPSPATGRCATR